MVRYRPIDKVLDGLLGLLCGAKTISQSNVMIRVDPAVQRAFGRTGCAEQSTIARTLQASTTETVAQLERLAWYYLKRYGQTPHHRFAERLLWIDVDVTPLPIGAQAEGSERTWMGRNRSKTGRKTLRFTASAYREILHETLLRGKASAVPALKTQRSARWKPAWGGRESGGSGSCSAWMGALARRRCSTGSSVEAIRWSPRSATAVGCASCARPWAPGKPRRAQAARWPLSCTPTASVGPHGSE